MLFRLPPLPSITPQIRVSTASSRRAWSQLLAGLTLLTLLVLAGCGGAAATSNSPPPAYTRTPTPPPAIMYVALGASDAVGVGADNPNTQGYVPIIISRLPKGSGALNLGISGIKLHDALSEELPMAIEAHPTFVTVWLAANDFRGCVLLQQYTSDLNTLLTQLGTQTHAKVFVANLPDMSLLPYFKSGAPDGGACVRGASQAQVHALAAQWNQVIDAAITQHGDVLVDLFNSDLAQHPEYISPQDGFHPSSQGYMRLADLFWAQIVAHRAAAAA